jgi:hypothetical protein
MPTETKEGQKKVFGSGWKVLLFSERERKRVSADLLR